MWTSNIADEGKYRIPIGVYSKLCALNVGKAEYFNSGNLNQLSLQ